MLKKIYNTQQVSRLLLLSVFLAIWGCATISKFDQYAYVQTTSLKVDALEVMDLAADSFDKHAERVKKLTADLQKVYEYEKNRGKNNITVSMWEKLLKEDGHLLGGFLTKWKTEGPQGKAVIGEAKKIIGPAFDQIAQLESKKIKANDL